MNKPVIGISGSHLVDDHGAFAGYRRAYVNDDYVRSVAEAGGIPVILPFTSNDEIVMETMNHVDGLLLSGGHDVYPLYYDEEPMQEIGPVWPERDHFDFLLLERAEKQNIPIMAICRGHQIVNVYHGGSLYQDLTYDTACYIKHSQNQDPATATHTVIVEADSRLAGIIKRTEWITNSHHHQTIKRTGEGLRIVARAKDGTIEAMEGTVYPYLQTYQFHPEMMTVNNREARCLFDDFIQAAGGKKNNG
ncbi:MAG: gamma-glutamyl-gamma-aminobutyrate hydrolase family protein [Megasphaera sp.]|jgi:putative glutamine amidotransferase|uniref:gamma-glutamyl-gamma-aminobutyrate hydrolase family protein n=1 Tax=Megasphaera sueciensis TaxID=349094 RepID=UPI003CFF3F57|nr:gamma-glutamyl-gamma-aminobutyrate hydrolase family protein [Megasphaera sp.]MCI1824105.1 gamma-glutamyl-gamma-aminobutyrate hydrolase family protein [Megasphaera sp.]